MSGLNATIVSAPEVSRLARRGGDSDVHVYESFAVPGAVSVALYGPEGFRAGTRLTREQVSDLVADLSTWLDATPAEVVEALDTALRTEVTS